MEALKQRIKTEGVAVGSDRINVDGFINHKIDTRFMDEIGAEFGRRFADTPVDKILTVEASGIAIALAAARYFDFVPVVFAKKAAPNTMVEDCYTADAFSFTKQTNNLLRVAKKHLEAGERRGGGFVYRRRPVRCGHRATAWKRWPQYPNSKTARLNLPEIIRSIMGVMIKKLEESYR